ncbi:GAP family protein [Gordonia sp. HY002]|uniref:GAP family protein n=1 Tax=Gordonia zhenghanii TaxID=2911516 RepID=UPI001EF0EC5B|nr:GAP family protein [Gordonia zhenghanii]MCF8571046.1 GAP family protein [Gordonia zhenghanii]MCF8606390.1 GAP family protein [Gordonia zhenghanii]
MGAVIGDLLPLAVGVAVSPVPVIAAILMLMGVHARTTSLGFVAGWVLGVAVATTVFVFLGQAMDGAAGGRGWIKLVLGVALFAFGVHQWKSRSGDAPAPKWMGAIDQMAPPAGTGIGFVLAAVNPKNLMLCVAAGMTIGSAGLDGSGTTVAVIVFTVLASSTVAVPVIAYQIAADRLRTPLDSLKGWLQKNNQTVMAVLILVIGAVLIGKGIGGVTA